MSTKQFTPTPSLAPPNHTIGLLHWLKQNLFSSLFNSVLTLLMLYLIWQALYGLISWGLVNADFIGSSSQDCTSSGACWVFIADRMRIIFYGFYPDDQLWRINTLWVIFIALIAWLVIEKAPYKKPVSLFALTAFPCIAYLLLYGAHNVLPIVETHLWGGLTLTVIIAFVGIVFALPLGILLALGRRSSMPIISSLCTVFIEVWRGVPMITVLFMASVMLPLFLPEGAHSTDKLLRALIGITLFQSAYMAEVIRGGLQAIPKGQFEAADSLALSYSKSMFLIILPQALKIVIPGIVNTFIALFKDTTLVLIIGFLDILAIVQAAVRDPEWPRVTTEGYLFTAFVFWIFCFGMSHYSQYLEKKLHTGH